MARFYGSMQGTRGEATRMGDTKNGFDAHVRGWNVGVRITCRVDKDGKDVIEVWETGGSNRPGGLKLLAEVKEAKQHD